MTGYVSDLHSKFYLLIDLTFYLSSVLSIQLNIYSDICLSSNGSILLSIYPVIYLKTHISFYLSVQSVSHIYKALFFPF